MVNFAAQKEKEAKVLADLKGLVEKVGSVRTTFPAHLLGAPVSLLVCHGCRMISCGPPVLSANDTKRAVAEALVRGHRTSSWMSCVHAEPGGAGLSGGRRTQRTSAALSGSARSSTSFCTCDAAHLELWLGLLDVRVDDAKFSFRTGWLLRVFGGSEYPRCCFSSEHTSQRRQIL